MNTEETRSPVSSTLKETVEEPIQNTEKKGSSVVEAPNPVSIEPDKLPDEPIQNLAQEEVSNFIKFTFYFARDSKPECYAITRQ